TAAHGSTPLPGETIRPATAVNAIATPMRSLNRFRKACMSRLARPAGSAQAPDRRQVLPVDEVVQDEGTEEHQREHEGARHPEAAAVTTVTGQCRLHRQAQRADLVGVGSHVELLAEQDRAD